MAKSKLGKLYKSLASMTLAGTLAFSGTGAAHAAKSEQVTLVGHTYAIDYNLKFSLGLLDYSIDHDTGLVTQTQSGIRIENLTNARVKLSIVDFRAGFYYDSDDKSVTVQDVATINNQLDYKQIYGDNVDAIALGFDLSSSYWVSDPNIAPMPLATTVYTVDVQGASPDGVYLGTIQKSANINSPKSVQLNLTGQASKGLAQKGNLEIYGSADFSFALADKP